MGALLTLAVLMIAVCSSPPEHEPSTEVEPALTETITSHEGSDSVLKGGKGEFVDREANSTADPTAAPALDPDMEKESVGDHPGPEASADEIAIETEASGIVDDFYGAAVASIEERIFLSDVIGHAVLVSVGDDILHFRALDYLMGTGAENFSVSTGTDIEIQLPVDAAIAAIRTQTDTPSRCKPSHIHYLPALLMLACADTNTNANGKIVESNIYI